MTREIPLTQGFVALVDDEDYDRVIAAGKWYAARHGARTYAQRRFLRGGRRSTLTGFDQTDHHNGDGLDNRRANLRPATVAENQHNARRSRDNTSGFKGVHWQKDVHKWRARISTEGRRVSLGSFPTAEEAARAYDAAARELHRRFASLNFPRTGERSAR